MFKFNKEDVTLVATACLGFIVIAAIGVSIQLLLAWGILSILTTLLPTLFTVSLLNTVYLYVLGVLTSVFFKGHSVVLSYVREEE